MNPLSSALSRREALQALGIASAISLQSLVGPSRAALSQEASLPKRWKPYKSPDLAMRFDIRALASHPVCSIENFREYTPRLEKLLSETCSLKIWINNGVLGKNTLGAVFDNGWIERRQRRQPNGPDPVRFHTGEEADIRSANGCGTLLRIRDNDRGYEVILSNDHVIYGAKAEIESQSISNHTFDINLLEASYFKTTLPDRFETPIGKLVDPCITNANLPSKRVQILGIGWDLFNFVGTPIPISFTDRSDPDPGSGRTCFALVADKNTLGRADVIGGMSGSPVVLEGTRDVVGTLSRVYTVDVGERDVVLLVFTGPDQLRALLETFSQNKKRALNNQKSLMATDPE
jgi:hypothetical protein